MRIAVLDADTLGAAINFDVLRQLGDCVIYRDTVPDEIREHLCGVEIAVLNKIRLGAEQLAQCPSLRLICTTGTGYDHLDVAYCESHGIAVCNVSDYCTDSVAQVTVAMALSLRCRLPEYHAYVADERYSRGASANWLGPIFHDLSGSTWGIVGMGHIGTRVGEIATVMGCRVLGFSRHTGGKFPHVDLDTLCRESDILSLHVPLTDATRGLIGERALSLMKPGALLINAARGAVTDEAAVARALTEGRLGGLGCDVYSVEPMSCAHPYYALRNRSDVCFTPHMAWGSVEARNRVMALVCENIRSFEAGERKNRIV